MTIKYKLKQNDFFQFNLFYFNEENSLKKIIYKNVLIWSIIYLAVFSAFLMDEKYVVSIFIGVIGFTTIIRKPYLLKKHYNKVLLKQTKSYNDKFNKELTLEINNENIITSTTDSETITKISQIEKIIETKDYYYIKLKPEYIFIPKSEIENQDAVKTELHQLTEKLNIEFQNKLDWKW